MSKIDSAAINRAIGEWAAYIAGSAAAGSAPLAVIGLISHGDLLARRLVRLLEERGVQAQYGALDISLYRDDFDMKSSKPALRSSYLPFSTDGLRVILVDDVVYTGRTARAALNALFEYGRPAHVELHTLADRGGRELPITPDYSCFVINAPTGDVAVHLQETDGCDEITC